MGERVPKPLKITESLPKKSAVRPVYSSPPEREWKSIGDHCRQLNSQYLTWEIRKINNFLQEAPLLTFSLNHVISYKKQKHIHTLINQLSPDIQSIAVQSHTTTLLLRLEVFIILLYLLNLTTCLWLKNIFCMCLY